MADHEDLTGAGASLACERAVFTSLPSPTGEGYRLVAWSSGLRPEERAELTRRGPSHGSLSGEGAAARGLGLFRLKAGGRSVVAVVRVAGTEHTMRGGGRVWTDFLLADVAAVSRAALHPAHARAAVAAQPPLKKPVGSAPLPAVGVTASPAVETVVPDASTAARAAAIASMLVDDKARVVATGGGAADLFEAALHLVPASLRGAVEACGGLRYSQARGVRVTVADRIDPDTIRATRGHGIECVDLARGVPAPAGSLAPWFEAMARLCADGRAGAAVAAADALREAASPEDVLGAARALG